VESWLVISELRLGDRSVHNLKELIAKVILLEVSKRVLALGHRVTWLGVFDVAILGMTRHFRDVISGLASSKRA